MAHLGWVVALIVSAGCTDVGGTTAPVVYGVDDRREVYAVSGVHRDLADNAIAMQIDADILDLSDPSDVRLFHGGTVGNTYGLCSDVAFRDQLDPGSCSGTLIDDRHILTAGHCVESWEACDGASRPWLFGFSYASEGSLRRLTEDDIYFCTDIAVFQLDPVYDYAVLELDRPVVGRVPARIRPSPATVGMAVTMIGHPNGIPMKVTGGATIAESDSVAYTADLDAFFGNSGSGVFDDGGQLLGVLVDGAPYDFDTRFGAGCDEVLVLDSADAMEGLARADVAVADYCGTGARSVACGLDVGDDGGPGTDADAGAGADSGEPPAGRRGGGCSASAPDAGVGAVGWMVVLVVLGWRRRRSKGALVPL